jgi:PKD repeat protein
VPANLAPVARFTFLTSTARPRWVSVDGKTSSDPDGTVAAYLWSWGDGTTSTGPTTTHTYAVSGTYTVTLTVTDNQGATGTTSKLVTVF